MPSPRKGKERAPQTPEEANDEARSNLYGSFAKYQGQPSSSAGGAADLDDIIRRHNWLRSGAPNPEADTSPICESSSSKPRRRKKKRTPSTRLALLGTEHEKLDLGDSSDGDQLNALRSTYHFESLALHNGEEEETDPLPGRKSWWSPEKGVGIAMVDGHPISTIGFEYSNADGDVALPVEQGGSYVPKKKRDPQAEREQARAEHEAVVVRAEQLERAIIRSQNAVHERDKNVETAAVMAREATEAAELEFASSAIGMRAKTGIAAAVPPRPKSDRKAMSGDMSGGPRIDVEAARIARLEVVLPHMQTRRKLQSISAALDAALRATCTQAQAQSGDVRGEPARSLGALLQGLAVKHYERGEAMGGNAGRRMMDRGIECQRLALTMEERLWNAEAGNSSLLVIHRGGDAMDLLVEKETTFAVACEQACRYWDIKSKHWCIADANDVQWMPDMLVVEGLHRSTPGSTLHLLKRIVDPPPWVPEVEEEDPRLAAINGGGALSGTAQERTQQAVEQQGANKGLAIQVEDLGVKDAVKAAPRPKKEKEPPKPKRCAGCCTPRKKKEKKEKAGRTVHARSRVVMFRGLVLACMLLCLLSLALDSTLYGIRIFQDFEREIWAANDVCTELRGSITATPFHSYAQRDFHNLRRVSHLYDWFKGPLALRLFEGEGGGGGGQSNSTSTIPAVSRSVVLSGLRIKQLRIKPVPAANCSSSWLDNAPHVDRFLFTTLGAPPPMPPSAPPSPPPPLQPGERLQARLQVTATVAGSVETFDAAAQGRFVTGLAAQLGVEAAQVAVTSVAPASILVTAAVSYDSVSLAQAGAAQWSAISAAELGAAIGTAVEAMGGASVTEVILGAPSSPPLPPLEPGSGDGGEGGSGRELGSGDVGSGGVRRRVASLTSEAGSGGELGSGKVSAVDHPVAVSRTTGAAAGDATLCYPDPRYLSRDPDMLSEETYGLAALADPYAELTPLAAALRQPSCIPDCAVAAGSAVLGAFEWRSAVDLGYPLTLVSRFIGGPDSGFALTVAANTTLEEFTAAVEALEKHRWIDRSTRHILVELSVYNPAYGTAASMQLHVEVTGAGQVRQTAAYCDTIPVETLVVGMYSAESVFPIILFVWLLGYFAVHLRRLVVTKCARIFETDQMVHWAIIWTGFGGLGFRGLALYKLFEMKPVFEATSPWPPPYLAGLTLAVSVMAISNVVFATAMMLVLLRITQYLSLLSTRLFVMRRSASNALVMLKYVFMLITFFSFVMGIYGNLVLGPSVEQWRTFGQSMRNLVPMLRRPDAFSFEAAQAVDDTALAVWGIYPVAGFFFLCAVFTNAFVLLNLARAVVIHAYIKTDAQFWRRRPDDVTREPMNLIYYMRQPYEDYRGVMRMRKFHKSQVKDYAMQLMEAKGRAREQAQDAIDDEKERVRELKKAEKEAAEAAKEAEA